MAHAIFVAEARRRRLSYDVYSAGVFDFRGAPPIRETTNTCELNNTPAPEGNRHLGERLATRINKSFSGYGAAPCGRSHVRIRRFTRPH